MNLYLISQGFNSGWDTYDSAVVCADNERQARLIHPGKSADDDWHETGETSDWVVSPDDVKVIFIGVADVDIKKGIVLSSFNAG